MTDLHTGELLALATAFLWTLSSLAWTSAGKRVGAMAVSFIRLVIAAVLMMVYCRVARGLWLPTDADGAHVAAAGRLRLLRLLPVRHLPVQVDADARAAVDAADVLAVAADHRDHFLGVHRRRACRCGIGWRWRSRWPASSGSSWNSPTATSRRMPPGHRWRGVVAGRVGRASPTRIGTCFSKKGDRPREYDAMAATLIRALVALPAYVVLITLWRRWPAMLAATRDLKAMGILTFGAAVGPFIGVALSMVALRYAPAGRRRHDHRHDAGVDPAVQHPSLSREGQPARRRRRGRRRGRRGDAGDVNRTTPASPPPTRGRRTRSGWRSSVGCSSA